MVLLLLLLPAQDLDELVDRLDSESVDARAEAAGSILRLGPSAIPAIEKILEGIRGEKRLQLESILAELKRRERVAPLRPFAARVSLALKNASFSDGMKQVFEPFGAGAIPWDPGLADRRVTIECKDAGLWKAADSFFSATGTAANWARGGFGLRVSDAKRVASPQALLQDAGEYRLVVGVWGDARNEFDLHVFAAPGTLSLGASADLEIVDDQGRALKHGWDRAGEMYREPGTFSAVRVWSGNALREDCRKARSLRIRGTVTLRLPRDVERREADATREEIRLTLGGADIRLQPLLRVKDGEGSFSVGGSGGREVAEFVITIEDAERRWLGDAAVIHLRPDVSSGYSRTFRGPKDRVPSSYALYWIREYDEIRIPVDEELPKGE